jgi:NADPH:quinone reductase-like Zn-dependent oxidoreductase
MSDQETNRLLGTLIAKIEGLEKRMDRADSYARDHSNKRDTQIQSILTDVEELKQYMIENKGGKKMLVLLLAASGGVGAFLTELAQKLMHLR